MSEHTAENDRTERRLRQHLRNTALDAEADLDALLAQVWDACFDDCYEQIADGMNPANRNPYRVIPPGSTHGDGAL